MRPPFFAKLILLAVCCVNLATTYVITEGGKEVGRYDENDGKNEVVEMPSDSPKPVLMKKEAAMKYSQDAGYSAELAETGKMVPDKHETLRVSGRVLDLISLKPVPGGKLICSSDLEKIEVPVAWTGSFSAKLPKPEKTALSIVYEPPPGYRNLLWRFQSGQLSRLSPADRRQLALGAPFMQNGTPSLMEMELGVSPEKIPSEKEMSAKYGT